MSAVLRGAGAILAGLVAGMIVVVVLTYLAVLAFFGGDMNAPPTPTYLALNLTYSSGAAVLAGWLAGRLAGSRPLLHAAGVAALMFGLSVGGGSSPGAGVPEWYGPTLMVMMPLCAIFGGWLYRRRVPPNAAILLVLLMSTACSRAPEENPLVSEVEAVLATLTRDTATLVRQPGPDLFVEAHSDSTGYRRIRISAAGAMQRATATAYYGATGRARFVEATSAGLNADEPMDGEQIENIAAMVFGTR